MSIDTHESFCNGQKRNYPVGKTAVTKTKEEKSNRRRQSRILQGTDTLNDKYQEEATDLDKWEVICDLTEQVQRQNITLKTME